VECPPNYTQMSSDLDRVALTLAQRVAADPSQPVGLIDRDNRRTGSASLPQAVASGSAFYVRVASHLIAIDADDVGPNYFALIEALTDLGIEAVEVASGGEGRRHLYLSLSLSVSDLAREELARRIRRLGLDPRRDIRPPLSPHRISGRANLLSPTDPAEAAARLSRRAVTGEQVARLARALGPDAPEADRPRAAAPTLAPMSEDIARIIREGDTEGRYASASEAVWAVLLAAANREWPLGRVIDALSGSPLWTQSSGIARNGERFIEADYQRALDRVAQHPRVGAPEDVRLRLARLKASAVRYRFRSGFGSRSDTLAKAVEGLLDIASRAGTTEGLNVSCYLLADSASMGHTTAARALLSLSRQGVIEQTVRAHGEMSATYRLRLDHPCFALDVPVDEYRPLDVAQDAFRARGAIGAAGWRLLTLIASSHTPTAEADLLATYGTRSPKALRRLLRRIEQAGLIVSTEEGWLAVPRQQRSDLLADLAAPCGHLHTEGTTGLTLYLTKVDCDRLKRHRQRKGWKRWRRQRRAEAVARHRTLREEADAHQAAEMTAEYAEREALRRELIPTG
jgi:hypothetical protein